MSKRCVGMVMTIIGISAVAAGLGLSGYNLWDDYRAGIQADIALDAVVRYREEREEAVAEDLNGTQETQSELVPDFEREMQVLELDGHRYIGTVSIPAIDVALPVQGDWSPDLLKTSPCRYMGSPYRGDLIICAHNYDNHFGRLKNLLPGDEVIFTDMAGNEFCYTVMELDTLAGTAMEEMESGTWDLTLFTCTLGGQSRVAVRCDLLESGHINENTQVWKQGLQNWVSIAQSGIVLPKKDKTVPPPLTANQMNNKPIVFLLLVPIISTFMQYLIAGWLQVNANKLWWVAVGLNIICCTMDYYRVKKAGYNADKLMAAFVFLIHLYIYKRMALVKGKKWTFTLIWVAVFVLDILIPATFWVKAVNMSNPAMISSFQHAYERRIMFKSTN